MIETAGAAFSVCLNGRGQPMTILDPITGHCVTIDTSSRPRRWTPEWQEDGNETILSTTGQTLGHSRADPMARSA
jgi:hypothetical protein